MPAIGSKRNTADEYDEVDQYKKSRAADMKMRMLLVGRDCGFVIGKGGENLARLRKEHNVQIDMPTTRTIDRVVNIDGSIENCVNVAKEILPGCTQAPYPVGQKCAFELNLLAHTDAVGMVIGKGGAKIKEIRDTTESKLKVYQECLPSSNERIVAIGGDTEDQVIEALSLILNILNDAPIKGRSVPYDPSNKPSEIMSGGMTGSGNMGMQQNMGGNMGMQQNMGGNMGMQHNTWGADRPDGDSEFLQLATVSCITVPNDMCGAIIGKAGSNIREIRGISGAKIQFTESDRETNQDRVITVTGTQQQVLAAEQQMAQYIRNRSN